MSRRRAVAGHESRAWHESGLRRKLKQAACAWKRSLKAREGDGAVDSDELCFASAGEIAAAIKARRLSPVEVVDAYLAQIERRNPTLNAFCAITAERARREARLAEAAVMAARSEVASLPLFHGVPFAVKDVTYTAGVPTTIGSRLYAHLVPDDDAPLVARLRAAGAILLGKTTTPELGWKGVTDSPLFGISRNPWNTERTPGGSSGGSAAALAAGMTPLATGTDGAGSIRIPASFCGVYGLKPSFGRVPNAPPSAAELLAHAGPMTRTVRDAAAMLDVMAGPDERDRNSLPTVGQSFAGACDRGVAGLRVAWSPDLGAAPIEPEVRIIAERAALRFQELGAHVEAASPGFPDPHEAVALLFYAGIGARLSQQPHGWEALVDPGLLAVVEEYRGRTAYELMGATFSRNALWETVRRFFERYDVLLTPTMPLAAFPVGKDVPDDVAGVRRTHLSWTPFTYPFNLTGQPAATVPCGWTADGLPVGLQVVGRRFDEVTVLRASAAFEALAPWRDRRPPLDGR